MLVKQEENLEKQLEDANRKLTAARLGESLERDQRSERLQVIEQPSLPQKPIKPNQLKLLALVFGLAGAAGLGSLFAAESLDRSIRSRDELLAVVDSHLIVALPYISTKAEVRRKKTKIYAILGTLALLLFAAIFAFVFFGPPLDLMLATLSEQVDFSWIERLTRLTK